MHTALGAGRGSGWACAGGAQGAAPGPPWTRARTRLPDAAAAMRWRCWGRGSEPGQELGSPQGMDAA